ncbi:lysophospholipid acyltransferase family protein [Solimonas soli]|uniref:lysophospholipid acyltransferase family protein n=1 Tax=Solimonas soli TaxID=413479 RepID=UPI00047F6EF0|nr:lysophospholipid acyltransferase family protein [Solimonas soli]
MSDVIEIGASVPRHRRPLLRIAGRCVLRAGGWRLQVRIPDQPKLIVIAAPHTSNWDFVFGLAAVLALELELHWFGKHTIFKGPWGRMFRALGGIAIDRGAAGGVVRQTARTFGECEQLVIGLAPEGTRTRVARWKRGFYHMASEAGVPVLVAGIDYREKRVLTGPMFKPSGDWDADMAPVFAFYRGVAAKRPENFAMG